jgi:hypothetical protein
LKRQPWKILEGVLATLPFPLSVVTIHHRRGKGNT